MTAWDKLNERYRRFGPAALTALELAAWQAGEKAAAELERLKKAKVRK